MYWYCSYLFVYSSIYGPRAVVKIDTSDLFGLGFTTIGSQSRGSCNLSISELYSILQIK